MQDNTTGSYNTAIGESVFTNNTEGVENVAIGNQALSRNTTTSFNTAVGSKTLFNSTTGYQNVALGYAAGFNLEYGGTTTRCPTLVRECQGPQVFDGNNDVAWLELKGCCTLGVTWYGTSTDEADMALNLDFNWATDGVNNYDVETVYLHEQGHVGGVGHSQVQEAIMYASYQEVLRVLHQDDKDGITSLYPANTSPDPSS